jgi:DNA (cytosine-5)-methyltransferase 1
VYANEFDQFASSIYRYHWQDETLQEADIHSVNPKDLPDFGLLVGGFPCQPFSIAGKREGFADKRGTLFNEILRVAKEKRPEMLLLENVPGLLSIEQGGTFEAIIRSLAELGYICEWQVFDSKFFGVPQQRRRVFIVAYTPTIARSRGTFFPIPTGNTKRSAKVAVRQETCSTLDANYWKGAGAGRTLIMQPYMGKIRVYKDHAPTICSRLGTGGGNVPLVSMILGDNTKGNIKQRVKDVSDNPSWTLGGCQTLVTSSDRIRRLTPIECERLQGFPDNWTRHGLTPQGEQVEISNTQRYKTLGNAVTVNVITALGQLILQFLDREAVVVG